MLQRSRITGLIAVVCFTLTATGCLHPGRRNLALPGEPSVGDSGGSNSNSNSDNSSGNSNSDGSLNGSIDGPSDDSANLLAISSVVSILGLGVLLVFGGLALTDGSKDGRRAEKAREYLKENRRGVQVALSRGSGPMIDDLAMDLALPAEQVARLGQVLQDHRDALSAYIDDGEVSLEEAEGFCVTMVQAIEADAALAPYMDALQARLLSTPEAL